MKNKFQNLLFTFILLALLAGCSNEKDQNHIEEPPHYIDTLCTDEGYGITVFSGDRSIRNIAAKWMYTDVALVTSPDAKIVFPRNYDGETPPYLAYYYETTLIGYNRTEYVQGHFVVIQGAYGKIIDCTDDGVTWEDPDNNECFTYNNSSRTIERNMVPGQILPGYISRAYITREKAEQLFGFSINTEQPYVDHVCGFIDGGRYAFYRFSDGILYTIEGIQDAYSSYDAGGNWRYVGGYWPNDPTIYYTTEDGKHCQLDIGSGIVTEFSPNKENDYSNNKSHDSNGKRHRFHPIKDEKGLGTRSLRDKNVSLGFQYRR